MKQNNIELENGQWYRLSLNAKSDIDRKLMFAIQRDGTQISEKHHVCIDNINLEKIEQ